MSHPDVEHQTVSAAAPTSLPRGTPCTTSHLGPLMGHLRYVRLSIRDKVQYLQEYSISFRDLWP